MTRRRGRPWRRLTAQVRREERTCWLCLAPIDLTLPRRHPRSFSVDHVIPVSLAPHLEYVRTNLRAAHYGCNSARGARPASTAVPAAPLHTSRRW